LLQLGKDEQVVKIRVIIEIDLKKLTSRGATAVIAENREGFRKAIVDQEGWLKWVKSDRYGRIKL